MRNFKTILFYLVVMANLSLTWLQSDQLLSNDDIHLEEEQEGPALSSAIDAKDYWESFNQWQCFDTGIVTLEFVSHLRSPDTVLKETKSPSIRVDLPNMTLDFDLEDERLDSDDFPLFAERTAEQWKTLLKEEKFVCFYGAYLQRIEENHSYWLISKIKTGKGYWQ
jgi:hypothetical protein